MAAESVHGFTDHRRLAPYPHEGGCFPCRMERRCNACGVGGLTIQTRCTNGRCMSCHATVCRVYFNEHGYGHVGGKHYIAESFSARCRCGTKYQNTEKKPAACVACGTALVWLAEGAA